MSYTSRGLIYGEESTFGASIACTVNFNNLFTWEGMINESVMEKELVSGDRDAVARAALQREVTGRMEGELINAKLFVLAMGTLSARTVDPYTITPAAVVDSFTLQRILAPTDNAAYFYGCKVEGFVLNLEVGEDVTYELNFIAQDGTLTTDNLTAPSLTTVNPFMYYHGMLTAAGSTITELQSVIIEISNNLSPRYSADRSQTMPRGAYAITEGRFQVTGRFTCGGLIETLAGYVLNQTQFTLELTLVKTTDTITINMPNVQLTEFADALTGREPYEIEFPFIASPQSGLDAMSVVHSGDSYNGATIV